MRPSQAWIAVACLLAAGCASVTQSTTQTITVETTACRGATCKLHNNDGTWYVTTPGSVPVGRAYDDLVVVCRHDRLGDREFVGSWSSKTGGWVFGNILLGGIIGAGIDVATGSAYDYPERIVVPMDCTDAADTSTVTQRLELPALDASTCDGLLDVLRTTAPGTLEHEVALVRVRQGCVRDGVGDEARLPRLETLLESGVIDAESYRRLRAELLEPRRN